MPIFGPWSQSIFAHRHLESIYNQTVKATRIRAAPQHTSSLRVKNLRRSSKLNLDSPSRNTSNNLSLQPRASSSGTGFLSARCGTCSKRSSYKHAQCWDSGETLITSQRRSSNQQLQTCSLSVRSTTISTTPISYPSLSKRASSRSLASCAANTGGNTPSWRLPLTR